MSRLWRYGTCYSRIRDFVRAGFISDEAKPIWFDVWTNHPPFTNPVLGEKEPLNEFIFRPQVVNAPKRKNFILGVIILESPFVKLIIKNFKYRFTELPVAFTII